MKMKEHNTTTTERETDRDRQSEWVSERRTNEKETLLTDKSFFGIADWSKKNSGELLQKNMFECPFVKFSRKNFIFASFLTRLVSATSTGDRCIPISMLSSSSSRKRTHRISSSRMRTCRDDPMSIGVENKSKGGEREERTGNCRMKFEWSESTLLNAFLRCKCRENERSVRLVFMHTRFRSFPCD